MRRVCLMGAGKVAHIHAPALSLVPAAELVAVCDVDAPRAQHLADRHGARHIFTSPDDAIASGAFDFAHVLVPPDHHIGVARQLIDAGIGVLIEKPMGVSKAECETLVRVATSRRVQVGVNHNSLFYPAYMKLRSAVMARSLGELRHLAVAVNRPAEWLTRPPLWMLEHPRYLPYETAIHPLSQIYDLAGAATHVATTVSGRHQLGSGRHFFDTWQASLVCERATAQMFLSYGEYPTYQLVAICDDGVMTAEVEQNRFTAIDRTRWGRTRLGRYHEPLHAARKVAAQALGYGLENVIREATSWLNPSARTNVYFTSMLDSIASFHCGPSAEQPSVDGDVGMHVVAMCDAVTQVVADDHQPARSPARRRPSGRCDAVVLGATGFIGTTLVEQMASGGMTVRVMTRNTAQLPPLFDRPGVQIQQGDVADETALEVAIKGARAVVHLAHGGGLISWRNIESSMLEPARLLAQACLRHGVERLVWAGSPSSLYLGDPATTITGATPIDPRVCQGSPYEWGTARCEEALRRYARDESVPVCIVRPGIVLAAGGSPLHPGFGIWRGETDCVGWNGGTNPLPLVLAADVAAAIRLALEGDRTAAGTYNLVGDVRLSAGDCVAELREALGRPLSFHPAHPAQHQALAVSKWLARCALRRSSASFPTYRMIKSRACLAAFDTSDVKRDLGWKPVADRAEFIDQAFRAVESRLGD